MSRNLAPPVEESVLAGPEDYLDHLVHRGALQDDGTGRLACPIPSFRQFLVEAGT